MPAQVDIAIQTTGVEAARRKFATFADDLIKPIQGLTQQASRLQSAWSNALGILGLLAGPIGLVAGAAAGAQFALGRMVDSIDKLGQRGAANIEGLVQQFRALLRSAELASERVRQLASFAAKTPFSRDDIAAANRSLEVMSSGALGGAKALTMVGDAAAATQSDMQGVAMWVGRLYGQLRSGREVGEAMRRLQELGVVTGETRNAIESMVESGVEFSRVWGTVEQEIRRFEGAMADLNKTLQGMETVYRDTSDLVSAGFSMGFMEGNKAILDANIAAMTALQEPVENLGRFYGASSNAIKEFFASIQKAVVSTKAFQVAVEAIGMAMAVFITSLHLAAIVAIARLSVSLAKKAIALKADTVATMENTAATGANTVAQKTFIQTLMTGVAWLAVHAARMWSAAVAAFAAGAAWTKATFALGRFTFVAQGAIGVLNVLRVGIMWVVMELRKMFVAILTNSWMLFIALLGTLIVALNAWIQRVDAANKKAEAFRKATDDMTRSLRQQRDTLQSIDDLMKVQTETVDKLRAARIALAEAEAQGNERMIQLAQERVRFLENELADQSQVPESSLARNEETNARITEQRRQEIEAKEKDERAQLERAGPEEKMRLLIKRYQDAKSDFSKAQDEFAEIERVEAKQRSLGISYADEEGQLAALGVTIDDLKRKREALANAPLVSGSVGDGSMVAPDDETYEERQAQLASMDAQIGEITAKADEMAKAIFEGQEGLRVAMGSGSRVKQLEAAITLTAALKQKQDSIASTEGLIRDLETDPARAEELKEKLALLEQQRAQLRGLIALGKDLGIDTTGSAQQDRVRELELLKEKLAKENDINRVKERQIEMENEQRALQDRTLAAAFQAAIMINSLRNEGLRAALRELEVEREQIAMQEKRGQKSAEEADFARAVVDAREEALKRDNERAVTNAVAATQLSAYERQLELAERIGDVRAQDSLRAAIALQEEAIERRRVAEEARELFANTDDQDAYIEMTMAEFRKAQAQKEQMRREDQKREREASDRNLRANKLDLQAEVLRLQGKSRRAKEVEELANRERDEVKRRELEDRFRKEGRSDTEARALADQQITIDQAGRKLAELKQMDAHIVASSTAQVGLGGNVTGVDPVADRLKDIKDYTAEILKFLMVNGGKETKNTFRP